MDKLHLISVAAILAALPSASAAQTVEETIVFLVAGIEEGKRRPPPVTIQATAPIEPNGTWTANGNGEFHFSDQNGDQGLKRITIAQDQPCKFTIHSELSEGTYRKVIGTLDLSSAFIGVSDASGPVFAKGKSVQCNAPEGLPAICHDQAFVGNLVDPERLLRATEHLKTYCRGRAF